MAYDIDNYEGDTMRECLANILKKESLPSSPEGMTVICEGRTFPSATECQRPVSWAFVDRGHREFLGVRLEDSTGHGQQLVFDSFIAIPETIASPEKSSWREGLSFEEISAVVEADEKDE